MSMNSRHVLDLRNTAFEQRHGDIIAVGTWFLLDDDAEPCLVLMRRRDFGRFDVEKVTPCVVRMQNLWIYDQERGQPEAAATECVSIAATLDIGVGMLPAMRVLSIIRDHIGDVIAMPPRPDVNRRIMADLIITNRGTGAQQHAEITDDV